MIDTESANRKFEKELKSGTAALLLLGVISAAGRPMYGYQITKEIEAASVTPTTHALMSPLPIARVAFSSVSTQMPSERP